LDGYSTQLGSQVRINPRSMGVKLIVVCGLAVSMTIPGLFVRGLVKDRTERAAEVVRQISEYAGGQQTYLTSRWFNEHAAEFKGKKMEPFTFPDSDSGPRSAYVAEDVPLAIGDTAIELHNVPVLTQPLGSASRDDVYGVIGVDGLDQFTSYTFDYRTMRFSASSE